MSSKRRRIIKAIIKEKNCFEKEKKGKRKRRKKERE